METLQTFLADHSKAIVLVIHGSGEHIGRYRHMAEWLNESGISMIGGDLPGLGKSTMRRGHIDYFDDYLLKVDQWLKYVQHSYPSTPVFLYGHSMGGLIVLRYLQEFQEAKKLKGVILTSPAVSIGVKIPKWQLIVAEGLKKVWPTFQMKSGIQPYQVSRSPEVADQYDKDPLNYNKVTIGWFFEFQKAIEEVWKRTDVIRRLDLPMLFLQAGADLLVNPLEADRFVQQLQMDELEYHHIPGLYHEIINEPEKEIYLKLITEWILNKS